ncbi:hypothetical protein CQZ93_18040 [Ochrobactrum vermis]|nr:hypothetical protein CQZ93_18040 [Ochrobactrum vermis]
MEAPAKRTSLPVSAPIKNRRSAFDPAVCLEWLLERISIGLNQIGTLTIYFDAHLIRKPFHAFRDAL